MNDLTLFDGTPDLERRVRSREAETSWDAARITRHDAEHLTAVLLSIITSIGPATDEQIFAEYQHRGGHRTAQRLRTARAELSRPKTGEPLVIEHATAGVTAAGNRSRRWVRRAQNITNPKEN